MPESLHVDLYIVDPLAGTRRCVRRVPADHSGIGAQVREGTAVYVQISEPHTLADCSERDAPLGQP